MNMKLDYQFKTSITLLTSRDQELLMTTPKEIVKSKTPTSLLLFKSIISTTISAVQKNNPLESRWLIVKLNLEITPFHLLTEDQLMPLDLLTVDNLELLPVLENKLHMELTKDIKHQAQDTVMEDQLAVIQEITQQLLISQVPQAQQEMLQLE
jgi:hypothetical protein